MKKELKAYLKSIGAYCSMIPGGAYDRIGDPDMIVCVQGRYLAIEAKVNTTQSGYQKLRQKQIEAAGGTYIIAKSVDDVRKAIEQLTETI